MHRTGEAAQTLAPKVQGTMVLDEVFRGTNLDFLFLCSSLSSLVGGFGQADYAGANAFLDGYAQSRAGDSHTRVISADWDLWRDLGMGVNTPTPRGMEEARQKALEQGIAADEGADAFARVLSSGVPQVVVSAQGVEARRRQIAAAAAAMLASAPAAAKPSSGEASGSAGTAPASSAPTDAVQKKIAVIWCELLGVKQVGLFDNFFDLGGHSLLGTQLIAQIRTEFQLELPLRSLLEVPTVAGMAERVRAARAGFDEDEE